MSDALQLEIVRGVVSILTPVLSAILLYFIGKYLTDRYAEQKRRAELALLQSSQIAQKQRELQLAAVARFYELYGEFFAIWKQWSAAKSGRVAAEHPQTHCQTLYQRACMAEGAMEAILVRLATEFVLGPAEVETLGKFRQAYQSIREAIVEDKDLGWRSADHPQYLALKRRACAIASMLTRHDLQTLPSADAAAASLLNVTDNKWEHGWEK